MKKIAVLLATYNGEKYLTQQIDSLFAQTMQDFDIVIHDDGSTDGTKDIIGEYRNKYSDRVEVIYGEPTGSPMNNFMMMLSMVEADIYLLCDQDDVWFPGKIEKSVNALIDLENTVDRPDEVPAAVFTDMQVVDENLNKISDSFIRYIGRSPFNTAYTQILIDNPAAGCTMCFNRVLRDLVISAKNVDWDNVPMHDAWILELAACTGVVKAIDEPLSYYRQTGHNNMGAETETESDKLSRNVELATSGSFLDRKKAFINEARLFAKEVIKVDAIPADKRKVLEKFSKIERYPKLFRMAFYRRHNFTRVSHNFWMRLWV
ncbi:MAG: glycosyltransferase family 2 protein [Pseudobutyrivibrio sp.]|nr:glycosyltransferase family 2 protein [Pseudobutyrivibrio sp.]